MPDTRFKKGSSGSLNAFYGYKHSEESKAKMRLWHLGHPPANKGKKIGSPSIEHRKKISESMLNSSNVKRQSQHYRWNPNRESLRRNERNDGAYKQLKKEVKKRDEGNCRLQNENCMGYRVIHHILPWRDYPEERYNADNCITLCQYHHPRKRVEEEKLRPILQELIGLKKY